MKEVPVLLLRTQTAEVWRAAALVTFGANNKIRSNTRKNAQHPSF